MLTTTHSYYNTYVHMETHVYKYVIDVDRYNQYLFICVDDVLIAFLSLGNDILNSNATLCRLFQINTLE